MYKEQEMGGTSQTPEATAVYGLHRSARKDSMGVADATTPPAIEVLTVEGGEDARSRSLLSRVKHRFRAFWKSTNDMPFSFITMYFLNGFYMSFPMTAYGSWLFEDLQMPADVTNIYYSTTFIPWYLKPVYGFISDNYPIFKLRRKPYIFISEILSAIAFVVTGAWIVTIAGAFVIGTLRSVFNCFSEVLLGASMAELVAENRRNAGMIQSVASGVRAFASVLAFSIGIPIYANPYNANTVIIVSAIGPLLAAVAALALPEKAIPSTWTRLKCNVRALKMDIKEQWPVWKPIVPLMAFLALYDSMPKVATTWYQYTFTLFEDQQECLQYSSLVASLGQLAGCFVYGALFNDKPVHIVFVVTACFAALAILPQLLLCPPVNDLGIGACLLNTLETLLTSFSKELAFLPMLVLATSNCPFGKEGLAYAIYVSFINIGSTISGYVTAPIVNALGIVPDPETGEMDWTNLWKLVIVAAASQVFVVALLPLFRIHRIANIVAQQQNDRNIVSEGTPIMAHVRTEEESGARASLRSGPLSMR